MNMRKVGRQIFTVAAVICRGWVGTGCTRSARTARSLAQAGRYYDAGQYDEAEVEYRKVLRLDAKNVQAMSHLGFIYFDQGRLSRAATFVFRARKLDTNNVEVRLKTGLIYLMMGNAKEAREEVDFVLRKQPQNEEAPLLLAELAGTPAEMGAVRQRLQTMPLPPAKRAACEVALGTLDLRQHNFKAAEDDFERAKALDPKSANAYFELGNLYWTQKDIPKADQAFKRAAEAGADPVRQTPELRSIQAPGMAGHSKREGESEFWKRRRRRRRTTHRHCWSWRESR